MTSSTRVQTKPNEKSADFFMASHAAIGLHDLPELYFANFWVRCEVVIFVAETSTIFVMS